MKRIIALCVIAVLVCGVFAGCDASVFYNETAVVDGLTIEISRKANNCFAGCYTCDGYEENMEITIPDSYDGVPLTQLGGYVGSGAPSPFCIEMGRYFEEGPSDFDVYYSRDGEKVICETDDKIYVFEGEYRIEEMVFTLKLGKNISKIERVVMGDYYPQLNEDGSVTIYHPVVYVVCSEENKHFYSENGRLYSRKTNELIKDFDYKTDSE